MTYVCERGNLAYKVIAWCKYGLSMVLAYMVALKCENDDVWEVCNKKKVCVMYLVKL